MIEQLEALKLEPGGTYVLQAKAIMSDAAFCRMRESAEEAGEKLGVKFLVLGAEVEIARQRVPVEEVAA